MNISKIRQIMIEDNIIFSFSGMISQDVVDFLIQGISKQLENDGNDKTTVRSMFTITIEMLQNIMSYSNSKVIENGTNYSSDGIVVIGFNEEKQKYYVVSSNEINPEDKEKLINKIDLVNSLDSQELRKLLRDKLRSAEDKHDRGAGVGFIEMAKRSTEKLEYRFEEINGKVYFYFKAFI